MSCGWGVKASMVRVWVAGKMCDPLVTHGPYLSALEIGHYKALHKFTFFTLLFYRGYSYRTPLCRGPNSWPVDSATYTNLKDSIFKAKAKVSRHGQTSSRPS